MNTLQDTWEKAQLMLRFLQCSPRNIEDLEDQGLLRTQDIQNNNRYWRDFNFKNKYCELHKTSVI